MHADTYLTIAPNQPLSPEALKDKCKGLFAAIDKQFLGPRWSKKSFDTQRTDGFSLIEHIDRNKHVQFAIRRPPKAQLFQIRLLVEELLPKFFSAATVNVQPVTGMLGLTSYNTKEQMRPDYEWHDQIILLRDFAN